MLRIHLGSMYLEAAFAYFSEDKACKYIKIQVIFIKN